MLHYGHLSANALFYLWMGTDNLTGSIDEPVEDGDSALHLACLYGHLPCVQVSHLLFLSATSYY